MEEAVAIDKVQQGNFSQQLYDLLMFKIRNSPIKSGEFRLKDH